MEKGGFTLVQGIIFFLSVFLAFSMIASVNVVIKSQFGIFSIIFGMVILALTTILRYFNKW